MWWSVEAEPLRIPTRLSNGGGKSFHAPIVSLHELEEELNFGVVEEDIPHEPTVKKIIGSSATCLAALPMPELPSWEVISLEETVVSPKKLNSTYWSVDGKFWEKWKSDENDLQKKMLETAKLDLENSKKAAANALKAERERKEAEAASAKSLAEANAAKAKEAEAKKAVPIENVPQPIATTASVVSFSIGDKYEEIMESGKQYRSEYISIWRDISLGVSTTAANTRSVQLNASKLVDSLSQAANRGPVITWLCAVCGSRIVSQAVSGNKALVWSFAYLARIIAEQFPEVVTIGIVGELVKIGGYTLNGSIRLSIKPESAKEYEQMASFWVALMCVFNDEQNLWKWVTTAVNDLSKRTNYLSSWEAQWALMKVYVLMDVGLFDFRRIFGYHAIAVVDIIENTVFPKIDAELQSIASPTSVSVQFRFYLDACYNILQSRRYAEAPDGQILAAAKESELNPDL